MFAEFLNGVEKEDAFVAGVIAGMVLGGEEQGGDTSGKMSRARDLATTPNEEILVGAAAALQRMRDELGCSICWGLMSSPISLQCGHSFCTACIVQWTRAQPSCPICREPTLSYRSYSENVALRELLKHLGGKTDADDEERTRELLESLEEAERAAEVDRENRTGNISPSLLNEIMVHGRVRAQGSRHPFQSEIRRSLQERFRLQQHREWVRSVHDDQILRELRQVSRADDPARAQLLGQLARAHSQRQERRTSSAATAAAAAAAARRRNRSRPPPLLAGIREELDAMAQSHPRQHSPRSGNGFALLDEIRSFTDRRAFLRETFQIAAASAAQRAATTFDQ